MAITFPNKQVALDFVEDDSPQPFVHERSDGWKVLQVTSAQVADYRTFRHAMDILSNLLGATVPSQPGWEEKNRRLHELLLAEIA